MGGGGQTPSNEQSTPSRLGQRWLRRRLRSEAIGQILPEVRNNRPSRSVQAITPEKKIDGWWKLVEWSKLVISFAQPPADSGRTTTGWRRFGPSGDLQRLCVRHGGQAGSLKAFLDAVPGEWRGFTMSWCWAIVGTPRSQFAPVGRKCRRKLTSGGSSRPSDTCRGLRLVGSAKSKDRAQRWRGYRRDVLSAVQQQGRGSMPQFERGTGRS